MTGAHEYRARQTMPIYEWSQGRWQQVGQIESGESFVASDHHLPNGGTLLALADGRGMVNEWCQDLPEIVRYRVGA